MNIIYTSFKKTSVVYSDREPPKKKIIIIIIKIHIYIIKMGSN